MNLFGGDHSVAHFVAGIPYEDRRKHREMQDAAGAAYRKYGNTPEVIAMRKAASDEWVRTKEERRQQAQQARDAGFKTVYRQFRVNDEAGKATAKALAEADAKHWSEKLGFRFEVCEGCLL